MNHYEILGISKNASQEEIKEAYKNLIKKYHPDIYQGDKSFAEKKTKEINIAYDILSNPESRQEYDEEITPTPTYNYTPPNYTPPSAYSYENYKRQSSYTDYDYQQRRYSDYHRSKTPNSNYSQVNRMHDEFSDNIVNSIDKMSLKFKLKIIIIILILYFFILVMSFLQINSILNGETTGTILNTKKKSTISNNITNTQKIETPNNSSPNSKEEFNINDYFSDSELYELYKEYYYDDFSTYSEFKSALSDYIYSNYSF